jgi:hypothetical protein
MTAAPVRKRCPIILATYSPTVPTAVRISAMLSEPKVARRALWPLRCGDATSGRRSRDWTLGTLRSIGSDLWQLEVLLRFAPNAIGRPRLRRRPIPLHRYRLQPQAQPKYPLCITDTWINTASSRLARLPSREFGISSTKSGTCIYPRTGLIRPRQNPPNGNTTTGTPNS